MELLSGTVQLLLFYVNMTNQDEEHRFSDYLEATQGSIIVEEGDCVATFRVNNKIQHTGHSVAIKFWEGPLIQDTI